MVSNISSTEQSISSIGGKTLLVEANSESGIIVPQGPLLLVADFIRSGPDLLLKGPDGTDVLIKGYFELAEPVALMTEGGALIPPDLVLKLAGPIAPGQYAQSQDQPDAAPIGEVSTIEGPVSATRADGTVAELFEGAPVYQGDVLETGANGSVGLVFIDNSSFAVGEDARVVLDELVYDLESGDGSSAFSLVQGVFVFVSGDIAKNNPDEMTLRTPVSNIAIRGTEGIVKGNAVGEENAITLLKGGPIEFCTQGGCESLSDIGASSFASSISVPPSNPVLVDVSSFASHYGEQLDNLLNEVLIRGDEAENDDAEGLDDIATAAGGGQAGGFDFVNVTGGVGFNAYEGGNPLDGPEVALGEEDLNGGPGAGNHALDDLIDPVITITLSFNFDRVEDYTEDVVREGNLFNAVIAALEGFGIDTTADDFSLSLSLSSTGAVTHNLYYGILQINENGDFVYTLNNSSDNVQELGDGDVGTDRQTFSMIDQDGITYEIIFQANVDGTNDAPVLPLHTEGTPDTHLTEITEDDIDNAGQTVASIIGDSIFDKDLNSIEGIAIIDSNDGDGEGKWQYSLDEGDSWIDFGEYSPTSALLLLATDDLIRFVPDGDTGTEATFTYHAWDQSDGLNSGTMTEVIYENEFSSFSQNFNVASITVTGSNDAPILADDSPVLTGITEDEVDNDGHTVAWIVGETISDVDDGADEGIAITGSSITTGSGTWEYSTDGGSNWTAFGSYSDGTALLLDAGDYVRFVPDEENDATATFTYRAWDQSDDLDPGTTADTTSNIDTSSFSTNSNTASIAVSDINDVPVLTGASEDLTETNAWQTASGTLTITDADDGQSTFATQINVSGDYGLFSLAENGGWSYVLNATTADTLTADEVVIEKFTVTSSDGTASDTVQITITGTNDTPILAAASPALAGITEDQINNGGHTVASIVGSTISDVDDGADEGIAITGSSVTTGSGTWEYSTDDGSNWTEFGSYSDGTALLLDAGDYVRFVPDEENDATATFTYRAWDQTSGSAGSTADTSTNGETTAFSTTTNTASIAVSDVNDVPVISGDTTDDATEDGDGDGSSETYQTASGTLDISDIDDGQSTFIVQTDTQDLYGDFSITSDGVWSYVLDNNDDTVQALSAGETLTREFTVTSFDETATETVVVTIIGTNDIESVDQDKKIWLSDGSIAAVALAITVPTDIDLNDDHMIQVTSAPNTNEGTLWYTVDDGSGDTQQVVYYEFNDTTVLTLANAEGVVLLDDNDEPVEAILSPVELESLLFSPVDDGATSNSTFTYTVLEGQNGDIDDGATQSVELNTIIGTSVISQEADENSPLNFGNPYEVNFTFTQGNASDFLSVTRYNLTFFIDYIDLNDPLVSPDLTLTLYVDSDGKAVFTSSEPPSGFEALFVIHGGDVEWESSGFFTKQGSGELVLEGDVSNPNDVWMGTLDSSTIYGTWDPILNTDDVLVSAGNLTTYLGLTGGIDEGEMWQVFYADSSEGKAQARYAKVEISDYYGSDTNSLIVDTLNEGIDLIYGADGSDDTLTSHGGNDTIYAGTGADTLNGGDGNDILDLGDDTDIDTVIFNSPDDGEDTLINFGSEDVLQFEANAFADGFNTDGVIFSTIAGAYDGSSVGFVFSEATDTLYYDNNTNGDSGYTAIASVSDGTIAANQIQVVE